MSRFGGRSEERPSVFKTRSKLGTHLPTQFSGDERQSRHCAAPDTGHRIGAKNVHSDPTPGCGERKHMYRE
ncbi:hypothetical protein TNCV_478261 [Trichonephila clavipes]|nr:hypothetical protein TNCV_478261 [Trichonephila clavipes]